MINLKKSMGLVSILLILFFSISGCSNKNNDNYCKCANCENFISSNNNSTNDTNNVEEPNDKNTKDTTIYNEDLNNNDNQDTKTNVEASNNISISNTITEEKAVDIVRNSNRLKNINENLRGGEHEVFFRSYDEEIQEVNGYAVHAYIYNPARNNGEEKIGSFFVSETGKLYFYDPNLSDYFPVN